MVEISRTYTLQAAHSLPMVPPSHKCGRLHGHTYKIELWFSGVVDERMGWFCDFADIDTAYAEAVHDVLDHRHLNVFGIPNPTTERLCEWVAEAMLATAVGRWLFRVVISENDRSSVSLDVRSRD